MPTFEKADKFDKEVRRLAEEVIQRHESYEPIREAELKIDYVMAFADVDDVTNKPKNDAIRKNGRRVYGYCRVIPLKDRAKGMGDVEIVLDGDYWEEIGQRDRAALLDHELFHIAVTDKRDDLGRPKIRMRKHDIELGWFNVVAERNSMHSIERKQAAEIMEKSGQYYWPGIAEIFQDGKGTRTSKLEIDQRK